ncbi:MAG TPA: hypothetical protein DIT99_06650 [Candidatus Latescibacteria bacterium]|nr:hypothetical protein [Candidatus Latescibacterota bacterium]
MKNSRYCQNEGVDIKRRTVAKYPLELNIPTASVRRELKAYL